jgi:hypothetical protein
MPLFLLVETFLGFTQNFLENAGNVPTYRKKGIAIQKKIVHVLPVYN